MARILVSEPIAPAGIARLREAGHEVEERFDLDADSLLAAIPGVHALIIRSATQVTPEVLAAASDLVVVGRAGIGLDNVEVEEATRLGVMVVNAPQSNVLSAAEHTMAMLLAQARNIPQAHAALKAGRWERSRWEGVELADKTLGIVGLGRIGRLVAQRAAAFGMRIVAHDPFVSADRARQINVELVELDELMALADFVTLHLAKTNETTGLIGRDLLARSKPGIRIINVARGGIVDEAALAEAVASGHVAGAAIDVFASEPTTESPLFDLDEVVVTPHLGASTREAQDKAGDTIAEQVLLALDGDFVPFAVNVNAAEVSEVVRPFLALSQELGGIFARYVGHLPEVIDVEFCGEIGGYDNALTHLSAVKGILSQLTDEPVSYVNAMTVAADRGCKIRAVNDATARDYVNSVTIRGGGHSITGTIVGLKGDHRIVLVDDHTVDVPPADHMLIIRNEDQPGMIGSVGTLLGQGGVNIDHMHIGRSPEGLGAMMLVNTDLPVPAEVQTSIRHLPGFVSVAAIDRDRS